MTFSVEQLDSLAKLLMDLAKGSFLVALAGPALSSKINLTISFRGFILGIMFVYWALRLIDLKEVK